MKCLLSDQAYGDNEHNMSLALYDRYQYFYVSLLFICLFALVYIVYYNFSFVFYKCPKESLSYAPAQTYLYNSLKRSYNKNDIPRE